MVVDEYHFKECLGCFATGVAVVTTLFNEKPYGVTVNSFASVSLHPPLVLFSLDKHSYCYPFFRKAKYFAVNLLQEKQQHLSVLFSSKLSSHERWEKICYQSYMTGCPVFEEVVAYLECRVVNLYPGGDHSIFIGKVLDGKRLSHDAPLLYYQGEYNRLHRIDI